MQHVLALRDGRSLSYTWNGQPRQVDAAGGDCGSNTAGNCSHLNTPHTVVYLHGFASSRLEAGLLHSDALHHGLSVLAVDWPGYGGSTHNPQQTVESTAADVCELLDELQLQTVVMMGASGGSPSACACAALLPERVEALLLVCPLMPTSGREEELLVGTGHASLRLFHGIREHPWRVWATLHLLRLIQRVPHGNLLLNLGGFADVDKQVVAELPEAAAIEKAAVREGLAQGVAGALKDLQIFYVEPPSIDLGAIRCKTVIWQGGQDTTTPPVMAQHYAATIPGAELRLLPGEGHLSLAFRHNHAILGSIVDTTAAM